MNDDERYAAGIAMRRSVFGDTHVDAAIKNATPLTDDFQTLLTRYVFGEIWTRPAFDVRTRRVLVIGTLVALGRWEEFQSHVRAALNEGGMTPDDVKEILLQQAVYCGVPAANHAFKLLAELAR
jgi:4-carboxymuconolactone decarboxylase